MNQNNIIKKHGGSITRYKIAKYLENNASEEMKDYLRFYTQFDAMIAWYEKSDYDPDTSIKGAVRRHIKRRPEEYHEVFESFFSEEEIKNLSMSLKGE